MICFVVRRWGGVNVKILIFYIKMCSTDRDHDTVNQRSNRGLFWGSTCKMMGPVLCIKSCVHVCS